jgi:hypothetical protein
LSACLQCCLVSCWASILPDRAGSCREVMTEHCANAELSVTRQQMSYLRSDPIPPVHLGREFLSSGWRPTMRGVVQAPAGDVANVRISANTCIYYV